MVTSLKNLLEQVDEGRDELISLHRDLVRIPSVNTGSMPTGNETEVCELVKGWLAGFGVETEILERVPRRGNLIARLEGRSGKAGLMFMSHTDVVPVEEEARWRFPPFSATMADGRVYGRGASDCKGLLASQLVAMSLLASSGVQLKDGLILASGADKEHGGRYGFGWLAETHPDKIAAPFAVNEGGGTPLRSSGPVSYAFGVGEKGRLQVEITVRGSSAHASVPWQGTNALHRLSQVLQRIEAYEPERDTSSSLFAHLSFLAIEHRVSPETVDEVIREVEADDPRLASLMRATSRMTVTPTMVSGGIKSNSVPESIRLTCDVRTLPHQDDAYLRQELEEMLGGIDGIDFEIDYMAVPNASPFETELMERISTATALALGRDDVQLVPAISTGFTDSRFTRPLGIVTYGYMGTHPDDDPALFNVHGTDESIGIESLVSGTKVMLALAYDLLAAR